MGSATVQRLSDEQSSAGEPIAWSGELQREKTRGTLGGRRTDE